MINKWLNSIQSVLMPPVCVLCGSVGANALDLCPACRHTLPWLDAHCARCALPLTGAAALCGRCQTQPPAFEQCLAAFSYHAPVDHLLQQLKFNGRLEMAQLLGRVMADWLAAVSDARPDHLIPVPLHDSRLRERGFNQALELARPVAKRLGLPLDIHSCRRTQATEPQTGLPRKARLKNIKGAFEVVRPVNGHVVIIDDVMTTGSTAHELAKMLRQAGADSVEVWVCARA